MKNTLGKLIIILTLAVNILAQTQLADYELTSNKSELFAKEAVEITFVAQQLNHHDVMYFFLEPKASKEYKIVLLNKEAVELAYHNKKTTFTFLVFPLHAGEITIDFDFTIKVASDEAVAQVFQGSRDNVKWIETINTKVDLKPLTLRVKKLKKNVDLIGDFHLTSNLDKDEINAYESANVKYRLVGTGYDDFNLTLVDKMQNVKIFSDSKEYYEKANSNGYSIDKEFIYAFIASHDINIKAKKFHCYSPKYQKFYNIATKDFHIKVTPIDKSTLVDKQNYPQDKNNFGWLKNFAIYLLIFLSGFISAKYMPTKFLKKNTPYQDIKDANNAKELLFIIMHRYDKKKLQAHYESLNDIVYNNAKANAFKKIKKQILKELD